MEMYSNACKEALTAKQKAKELHQWQIEEARKQEEARLAGEDALAIAEMEKAKNKAAIEAAEAARRLIEIEAQKRMNAEMKAKKEAEEKKKVLDALANSEKQTGKRKARIRENENGTTAEERARGEEDLVVGAAQGSYSKAEGKREREKGKKAYRRRSGSAMAERRCEERRGAAEGLSADGLTVRSGETRSCGAEGQKEGFTVRCCGGSGVGQGEKRRYSSG
ncbi:U-box domain-containing protein 51 [Nymphaea thermarum]|nr:U-box domain-containing protein 51 [Nymphaea thermarum]